MLIFLNIVWFFWELKYTLFWLFLWQLKDYHVGRFADHFRTDKGRRLIFSFTQILKLVLLVLFLISGRLFDYLFTVLFLIYLIQTVLFLRAVYTRSVLKPVWTVKTVFLTTASLFAVIAFWIAGSKIKDSLQPIILIGFDLLTP